MPNSFVLKIDRLSKEFGGTQVLRDVTIGIPTGTYNVLLGPPGAGKTTLLKSISGLINPDKGKILMDGEDITALPPNRRNVAMAFQSFALYPHMNVYQNISSPLKAKKLKSEDVEAEVRRVSSLLKIEGLLDRSPGNLSGGEKQRVCLARALVKGARVLLLDEPLTNLDAKIREGMRMELKNIQKELDQTIIHATPDPTEALTLADNVYVIKKGQILQSGNVHEVYRSPSNVSVATYLGSPTINLLDAKCITEDNQQTLQFREEEFVLPKERSLHNPPEDIIIGFRPDSTEIRDTRYKEEGSICLRGTVVISEVIGSDTILHLETSTSEIVRILLANKMVRMEVGEGVFFKVDFTDTYAFDKKTGERIGG